MKLCNSILKLLDVRPSEMDSSSYLCYSVVVFLFVCLLHTNKQVFFSHLSALDGSVGVYRGGIAGDRVWPSVGSEGSRVPSHRSSSALRGLRRPTRPSTDVRFCIFLLLKPNLITFRVLIAFLFG